MYTYGTTDFSTMLLFDSKSPEMTVNELETVMGNDMLCRYTYYNMASINIPEYFYHHKKMHTVVIRPFANLLQLLYIFPYLSSWEKENPSAHRK